MKWTELGSCGERHLCRDVGTHIKSQLFLSQ